MPSGRLTDYTEELLEKAWWYVGVGWEEVGDKVPSVAGLACELGISRETCYAWAGDEAKVFSDILDEISRKQERKLVNSGLGGDFKEGITKMMLSKHGYADAVQQKNFNVTIEDDDAAL